MSILELFQAKRKVAELKCRKKKETGNYINTQTKLMDWFISELRHAP